MLSSEILTTRFDFTAGQPSSVTIITKHQKNSRVRVDKVHGISVCSTKDVQQGEYGLVDTEYLEQLPQLEYFKGRPGRACLIMDDIHLHSHSTAKKDSAASQAELLERICGHMSTHRPPPGLPLRENFIKFSRRGNPGGGRCVLM